MTEPTNSHSSLIWADKTALVLTLAAGLVWGAGWIIAFTVIGDRGASYLWLRLGVRWSEIGLLVLISAWLLLRLADFAAGGTTFALSRRTASMLEDLFARAAKLAHPQGAQIAR